MNIDGLQMTIGQRIKTRRLELGMNQTTLASVAGLSQSIISHYESEIAEPTAKTVIVLARALKVSTDWLLGVDEKEPYAIPQNNDLNDLEQQALSLFRAKPDDKKRAILEIMRLA